MSDKLLEIKVTKATLFIHEAELFRYLPVEVIREGLKRGKAITRCREAEQRAIKELGSEGYGSIKT